MPPRRRNMLEIKMKEMKRQLLELEVKVAVQRVLLKTCNEIPEVDEGEIYLCEDESLYDKEVTPVNPADNDELHLYESKPIYDEEIIPTDQADDEKTYLYEGEPIYDEDVMPLDQVELLMIKQNLHTAMIKDEPSLCCNNFSAHYAFQEKSCNIGNGSCGNVVSDYMEQKLKLPIRDHLHPDWINSGNEVMIFESPQGVTSFSDLLADKMPPETSPDKPYYNAIADQRVKKIKRLQEPIRDRIQKTKTQRDKHRKQRIFNVGDLVWIHLRFLKHPNAKLSQRVEGPFKIVEKINDYAYKVELPGAYGILATFNVTELSPYIDDTNFDSRTSSVQPPENETEKKQVGT